MLNGFNTLVRRARVWVRELRRLRIDLVHLNNSCGGDHDLLIAALALRIPCLAHQRGFPARPGPLQRLLAGRFSRIVSISNAVSEDLRQKRFPVRRVTLVHDGIDPSFIRAQVTSEAAAVARGHLGMHKASPAVGIVGNVKAWKGQLTLVRAMAGVVRKFPDARCLVIGAVSEPEYQKRLEAEVEKLGLGGNVLFTGYQRTPAVLMFLLDVVVHASVDPEPFGIVLLEAMVLGKPVIASAHGGPVDIIEHGRTGLLAQPGDVDELAEALCDLLDDPLRREAIGKAASKSVNERFTARRNVEALEAIYDELLSR